MTALPPPLLEAEHIRLTFGGITAISDVSFRVEKGEFFAVIGPNGAGKTSPPQRADGFTAEFGVGHLRGRVAAGHKPAQIAARGIARTFQNLALFEEMTVLDNVVLGRHHLMKAGLRLGRRVVGPGAPGGARGPPGLPAAARAHGPGRHPRPPGHDLPYGVKKRIELARALAMQPTCCSWTSRWRA